MAPCACRWRWLALTPVLRILQLVAYMGTIGVWTIEWAGISYGFDRRGQLTSRRAVRAALPVAHPHA